MVLSFGVIIDYSFKGKSSGSILNKLNKLNEAVGLSEDCNILKYIVKSYQVT